MILYVDNKQENFDFLQVTLSKYTTCASFQLHRKEKTLKWDVGTRINIEAHDGQEIFEGTIEYIKCDDFSYIYSGRCFLSVLVDAFFTATKQFNKAIKASTIIRTIANEYDINTEGDAAGLQNHFFTCPQGVNVVQKIYEIASKSGHTLLFNSKNIIFNDEGSLESEPEFVFGGNIRKRVYKYDSTASFGKHIVQSRENRAESGTGDKAMYHYVNLDLEQYECKRIAQMLCRKDIADNEEYVCNVDATHTLILNNMYKVEDFALNINKLMRIKALQYIQNAQENLIQVSLEAL